MPGNAREQITLRLPCKLLEALREQAQERGDSLNETIIRYLMLGMEAKSRRFPPHSGSRQPS